MRREAGKDEDMKLIDDVVLSDVGTESVLVPVGAAGEKLRGIVRLNETAAFIVGKLQQETDAEAIIAALGKVYEGTREQFAASVEKTVAQLRELGFLKE